MSSPEDRLGHYRAKRDFSATAEPAGIPRAEAPDAARPAAVEDLPRRFVVQRHRARRLHYDFRLEVAGVLASWAVPQGPTLDPKARHLAVHVEDHPLEYFDFEGVIPKGQYGGGDVIVWDWGRWEPSGTDDPAAAIERGELHFDLWGEKLAGRFVLVRRGSGGGGSGGGSNKEQWLLLHKNDGHARPGWRAEDHPASVKSGRTNDEVAASPSALWHSDRPAAEAAVVLDAPPLRSWPPPTLEELEALDALGAAGTWVLQGAEVKLTNLDKVLFPGRNGDPPVTKRHLVRYYAAIAPFMLRYLSDRPVNMHRFPDGVDRPGFWHKELPAHAPEWISRWRNPDADPGEAEVYPVVDSVPALVWMANFGAVELNPWTSRRPDTHHPTWALIDVDPGPSTSFEEVLVLARLYRTALQHLGVAGMPKVTGQRGVQIWVPVATRYTFDETRSWVEKISRAVAATVPELVSWEWHKGQRRGLARLDYTQNAINKTLVAPFSARPAPGAPVSMPIRWDELDDIDLRPDRWTVRTALDRVQEAGDPLAELVGRPQTLPPL